MIKELNHIGLLTTDIEASKNFYVNILGGTIIRDHKDDAGSLFVYIQLALGVIELIRVPADNANKGFVHIAYLIDDLKSLDEYYEDLKVKGYEFTLAPKPTTAGDGRLAFFNDNSGVSFELIERKENIRIRDLVNDHIKSFHHISINVSPNKVQECDGFYTGEMGFTKTGAFLYSIDADAIELNQIEDPDVLAKPLSHICFHVVNCIETREYLTNRDIRCSEIIECDGNQCFNVTGPDNERILFQGISN